VVLYSRRLQTPSRSKREELRELALGAQRFHSSALGLGGIESRGGEKSAMDWMGEQQRVSRNGHPWATSGLSKTVVLEKDLVGGITVVPKRRELDCS
jgi:hypothetical protein